MNLLDGRNECKRRFAMDNFVNGFQWGMGFFLAGIVLGLCCGLLMYCLLVLSNLKCRYVKSVEMN